ncbi:unnamed protein product [Staurois parvus]|uniref:Uncharacterized protein n=1 Tax=Staurois parvus TaxID=386267 RepID=A0ABN9AZ63_9NEOB|nr:unnamed protein product [Staurois parvus]
MGDIERQLRWALICGIDVHWYALICGIDVALMWHWHMALMDTDRWHFWGHTDHQGKLIISALDHSERNADNRHFRVYM